MFQATENRLVWRFDAETLWIEPWGENSLRVRATAEAVMPEENWALLPAQQSHARIAADDSGAVVVNGKIKATVSKNGKIRFYNQKDELLLELKDLGIEEYIEIYRDAYASFMTSTFGE